MKEIKFANHGSRWLNAQSEVLDIMGSGSSLVWRREGDELVVRYMDVDEARLSMLVRFLEFLSAWDSEYPEDM